MKIQFTQLELSYLDANLKVLNLYRKTADVGMARIIAKMRAKFSPTALNSFLNGKERTLLRQLLQWREKDLMERNSASEELDIVLSLLGKVSV